MVFIWKCRIPRSQAHLCADGKLQPRRAVIEAILEVRVSFFLPLMGFCCGPEPGNKSQWNPGLTELFKVQLVLCPFVCRHRRWILLQQLCCDQGIGVNWACRGFKAGLPLLGSLQQSWYQCLGNPACAWFVSLSGPCNAAGGEIGLHNHLEPELKWVKIKDHEQFHLPSLILVSNFGLLTHLS